MSLKLHSDAFGQGEVIPRKYTCDGANVSPPFSWSEVPKGTRSFLLVCDDPDAPSGTFHHWAAFDLPADWRSLREGYGRENLEEGFRQAINDFKAPGYGGPCPPKGHEAHHYHFRLCALGEKTLPAAPTANCVEIIALARPYVLEFVELVGLYERKG